MPRSFLFAFFVILLAAAGCRQKPDRLITADGRVLSGELLSIHGTTVEFSGSSIELETDQGRLYLKEGLSRRGTIGYEDGVFTLAEGSGAAEVPISDVATVIWSHPSSEASVTLEVPAAEGWVPTGLEAAESQRICISATGRVSIETGSSGPQGIDYFSTASALFPGATNGQLILRVGESTPVAAGSSWAGVSPGDGELFLAVNRADASSSGGVGGAFTVTAVTTSGVSGGTVLYPAPR